LSSKDLEAGYMILKSLRPKAYQRLEKVKDIALVGIVGDGLVRHKGVAARCFTAVAECNVNVELSCFGPSQAALYFIVRNRDLSNTLKAIHSTFF
jgi:aspartokinase/homoserine dehydrogenase 1